MKTLTYTITISKPRELVFDKITDRSVYPGWAKAWGEGMTYEGSWKEGEHISFFDNKQGGTKVLLESIKPGEWIKARHIAMVNPKNEEVELTDEMMRKWIGTREEYYFRKNSENETTLEVIVYTDEAFEKMMDTWNQALQLFKEVCESQP